MTLRIDDFHWIDRLVDKIVAKHNVDPEEVESALLNDDPVPYVWREGERFLALSQVEEDGEYLFVVFVMEAASTAKVITARSMNEAEKRRFRRITKR